MNCRIRIGIVRPGTGTPTAEWIAAIFVHHRAIRNVAMAEATASARQAAIVTKSFGSGQEMACNSIANG